MSIRHKLKRTFTLVSSDGRIVKSKYHVQKWFGVANSSLTYNCFENKCETVQYLE